MVLYLGNYHCQIPKLGKQRTFENCFFDDKTDS